MTSGSRGRLGETEVLVGATYWALNGVNVFSANLVKGLRAKGIDAKVLLSEEASGLVSPTERAMPRPEGVPFEDLPVHRLAGWGGHWGGMIRHLESRAPCIWLPNSDYRHSGVCPRLSNDVMVVGVVHSDDPLHYDHVARLGATWNWATATSRTITERVLAAGDPMAGRLTTVPIGVDVPDTMPTKAWVPGAPLRLIYHGVLKKYQKRILDIVGVVERCVERGIPVELTVAGGGPDEAEVMEAARDLVARGSIRFLGVVPHHEIFALLQEHDVYILTSDFEGMPNAMLEAMGRGCVPLVTRMESGIPDLVADGENGFLVPIGDLDAFADRIALLQADVERRRGMATAAHARVSEGAYRVESMVDGYIDVFERVLSDRAAGRFVRALGPMSPPPSVIDGVSVFPIELRHEVPGVGAFPSPADARAFEREAARKEVAGRDGIMGLMGRWRGRRHRRALETLEVVVGTRNWTNDGLNDWCLDLVRGLGSRGVPARILVTEDDTILVENTAPPREIPSDIRVDTIPTSRDASWGAHWGAMVAYLEARSRPCVYIPNDDYRHSCVSSVLSRDVLVVGVLHSDDPLHHDHVARLGDTWNAIVTGNEEIAEAVAARHPRMALRLATIPYGLHIPEHITPRRPYQPGGLSVLWVGSAPPDSAALDAALGTETRVTASSVEREGRPEDMRHLMSRHDVFVMRSPSYGDIPLIREGMGQGCVPLIVASDDPGALPVRHGIDGLFMDGDAVALHDAIVSLASDRARLEELARRAHAAARRGSFRLDDMLDAYQELFSRIVREDHDGVFRRARGVLRSPPARVGEVDVFPVDLGFEAVNAGRFVDVGEYDDFDKALPRLHRLKRLWRAGRRKQA